MNIKDLLMTDTFEAKCKRIKKLYFSLFNKDAEVLLSYKGTEHGITKCFHIRCGERESDSHDYILAADQLSDSLKIELGSKISMLESQMKNYRQALDNYAN